MDRGLCAAWVDAWCSAYTPTRVRIVEPLRWPT